MQPFGMGTEIVEVLRIAKMIERHGDLFLRRVYTPVEIEFCNARREATQHFAARWAGKEAVLRALGTAPGRDIAFRDIEIRGEHEGVVELGFGGGARERIERLAISRVLLSLAHCRTHATAYALALVEPALEDADFDEELDEPQ